MSSKVPSKLLELRSVGKSYGTAQVLKDVDLKIEDGEFLVILGPSGSGKTTILRLIGGFIAASQGEILLDGAIINDLPINRRPFNTVFQDYALFPHMTVRGNVAYGLSVRGVPKAEIVARSDKVLALVSLGPLAERYPAQLSGGQRQRVALARAIVCEPRLVLLDEPLAALDVNLRRQMQLFLKEIQREIRTAFLFITHDQEEAITLADRICVMDHGKIMQIGAPRDLYDRPGSAHVARFFGDNNLIGGRILSVAGGRATLDTPLGRLVACCDPTSGLAGGDSAFLAIRPEKIRILSREHPCQDDATAIAVTIARKEFAGPLTHLSFVPDAAPTILLSAKRLSDEMALLSLGEPGLRACWGISDTWVVRA